MNPLLQILEMYVVVSLCVCVHVCKCLYVRIQRIYNGILKFTTYKIIDLSVSKEKIG